MNDGRYEGTHHREASEEQFLLWRKNLHPFVQEPTVSNRLRHLHHIATRIRTGLMDDLKGGEHANPFQGLGCCHRPSFAFAGLGGRHIVKKNEAFFILAVAATADIRTAHPETETQAEIVPPVIAVATRARTNRINTLVAATVYVVVAAVVEIAEPRVTKFVPSSDPSRTTLPAETPALVVTVAEAFALETRPSNAVPAPVAETAFSD
jgi:hypothetical protein